MGVLAGTVYATTTDLTRLGMLGSALSVIDPLAQTEALQYASAIADSYLQSHFVLPITQWGYDLVGAAPQHCASPPALAPVHRIAETGRELA